MHPTVNWALKKNKKISVIRNYWRHNQLYLVFFYQNCARKYTSSLLFIELHNVKSTIAGMINSDNWTLAIRSHIVDHYNINSTIKRIEKHDIYHFLHYLFFFALFVFREKIVMSHLHLVNHPMAEQVMENLHLNLHLTHWIHWLEIKIIQERYKHIRIYNTKCIW